MRIKITRVPRSIVGSISAKNVRLLVGIEVDTLELDDTNVAIVSIPAIITCFSEKHWIAARDEFADRGIKNNQLVLLPDEYEAVI
ncbi:hypothetical protein KKE14_01470 [Patescibacteria group bacterium]|nr:hypothetical protein [Patescibacteria group bacterium]